MSDSKAMPPKGRGPLTNFTEGPVHTRLIKLTGFMMMGFVSMIMASLVETVYIGMLGTPQLAAVSFTFPLVMIMQRVAMGSASELLPWSPVLWVWVTGKKSNGWYLIAWHWNRTVIDKAIAISAQAKCADLAAGSANLADAV